jgi:hypothetical protein
MAHITPEVSRYKLDLKSVERPAKARERYGPSKISPADSGGVGRFVFEDSLIRALIVPNDNGFAFDIENKTDNSIKIIWDEAAIVDVGGRSGRVMHNGVKYTDRNTSQPPSVIVRRGSVTDDVIPTDNVEMRSVQWVTSPMLPSRTFTVATRDTVLAQLRAQYQGKTIQLLLPLQIQDVVNEYIFVFEISDIGTYRRPPGTHQH